MKPHDWDGTAGIIFILIYALVQIYHSNFSKQQGPELNLRRKEREGNKAGPIKQGREKVE